MTSHITINQVEKNRRKMVELNFQKHTREKKTNICMTIYISSSTYIK